MAAYQPFIEYWQKHRCPRCEAVNWTYETHSERAYSSGVQRCKCHACHKPYWLMNSTDAKEFRGAGTIIADGKPAP